jgi:prepilin-type N-terminal cleavage/methylation domain-containing protein
MKNNVSFQTKGFTLIELLVVIAIIGILASVVLISFSSSTAKSRDSGRMQELKQIQMALRLYYDVNHKMPANRGGYLVPYCDDEEYFLQELVDGKFLPKNPKILNGSSYCYYDYDADDAYKAGVLLGFKTESYQGAGLSGTCRPSVPNWCEVGDNNWYCLCTPYSPYW